MTAFFMKIFIERSDFMSQKKELKIISSTNVEVREINWLWYPFIPRGKVTILQGDPGEGKSTSMLTLAAYLTRGEALPFTDCGESRKAVIFQWTITALMTFEAVGEI